MVKDRYVAFCFTGLFLNIAGTISIAQVLMKKREKNMRGTHLNGFATPVKYI